jgi:ubiquinone/menaquinone biosynthesis C-methylase UbiE
MSEIADRYDRDAHLYDQHWGSVLAASALGLLDRVDLVRARPGEPPRLVDVGTGTGVLAIEAARRWPAARVVAVDPSVGMLRMAAERARGLGALADGRLAWRQGEADQLPVADGEADVIVSSFVYQLVPDRDAAFREALRVLRPGGRLAFVTWLDAGDDYEPAVEFDEAVYDVGIEEPEAEDDDGRSGDFPSARSAADQLRRAGFRRVSARVETLRHGWTVESYLAFKVAYEERDLYGQLDATTAERLTARARERLTELPPEAFAWEAQLVSVVATRS